MGFFSRMKSRQVSVDPERVEELLSRGVAEAIVKDNLRAKLLSGKRLRVKLGIDPTSPDLHLGRSIPLLKMRDFQELGHQLVLIVGDFTAVIGDTSDKDAERPMLAHEAIERNMKTYRDQVGKIIDLSRVEFRHNSEWLEPLTYRQIGEHADVFSVADFIARENIAKRLKEGKRVSLREVLYPLMQGYDSVAVRADVELGGTDQKFNLLAGRTLQETHGQEAQNILMNPLIEGLDGRKMSSSWGNTIPLTASPADMYGKVMSMRDTQIVPYFTLCTRVPLQEVALVARGLEGGSLHPKDAKMRLAREVVALYHGQDAAQKAEHAFVATFSKGEIPDDVSEAAVSAGDLLLDTLATSLGESKASLRRLFEQGAVSRVGGETIRDPAFKIAESMTVRVGKHRFLKIDVT